MKSIIYNLAKFAVVLLSVSIVFTLIASVILNFFGIPRSRPEPEYVGIAAIVLAEIWAFAGQMPRRFTTRTLLIVAAIESLILGASIMFPNASSSESGATGSASVFFGRHLVVGSWFNFPNRTTRASWCKLVSEVTFPRTAVFTLAEPVAPGAHQLE